MIVGSRHFEMHIYHVVPGRLNRLMSRFRDHTLELFDKHGLTSVAYWLTEEPETKLVYILAADSPDAAEAGWAALFADPRWTRAFEESMVDGPLTSTREKLVLFPLDFSPIR